MPTYVITAPTVAAVYRQQITAAATVKADGAAGDPPGGMAAVLLDPAGTTAPLPVTQDGTGAYHVTLTLTRPGWWSIEWQALDTISNIVALTTQDISVPNSPTYVWTPALSSSGYPFAFGYCDPMDVTERVMAGTWNPAKTGSAVSVAQLKRFITTSAVQIDSALATSGYTVPIAPDPVRGPIRTQAYELLREINAAFATALVERARFGAQGDEASDADLWQQYGDELLVRIQAGDDNLALFGLASAGWVPDPNPALAMVWTGGTEADGNPTQPLFTRVSVTGGEND